MRHASAGSAPAGGDDIDRPLTDAGRAEAARVARALVKAGLAPDRAHVSAAERTRQTWDAVNEALPGGEVRFDRSLYNCDAAGVRRLAEQAGEGQGTVMVVGHNPGLQELAVRLLMEAGGPAAFIARRPSASSARVPVNVNARMTSAVMMSCSSGRRNIRWPRWFER